MKQLFIFAHLVNPINRLKFRRRVAQSFLLYIHLQFFILPLSLLVGCQSPTTKVAAPTSSPRFNLIEDPTILLQQANKTTSPDRESLMIKAAQIYLSQNDYPRTERLLSLLQKRQLLPQQQALYQQLNEQLIQQTQNSTQQNNLQPIHDADSKQKIAILLAESGRFQTASEAVRQGVMLAYYDSMKTSFTLQTVSPQAKYDDAKTDLIFFDSASGEPIQQIYQKAVSAGANVVIGPLDKEQVTQLAKLPNLTAPLLTLNYLPSTMLTSDLFFQFGLAAEDEAKQISTEVYQLGYRAPILLYPDNDWGSRSAAAFRADWQQKGGRIITDTGYEPSSRSDYTTLVKRALGVHTDISSGQTKEIRRQDIDAIVLISDAASARQLQPLINYYFANDLPIFATSHIFPGKVDSTKDSDINRVQFTEIPWLLDNQAQLKREYLNQPLASESADILRLVALGIDSFHLAPRLAWLKSNPNNTVSGVTGKLSLTADRKIHRQTGWAQFQDGRPIPLTANKPQIDTRDSISKTQNKLVQLPLLAEFEPNISSEDNSAEDSSIPDSPENINPELNTEIIEEVPQPDLSEPIDPNNDSSLIETPTNESFE